MAFGFKLGLGLSQRGVGGAPSLTLSTDSLDADPPVFIIDTVPPGTYDLVWDFATSATPPVAGEGDIATGTIEVVDGASTELDLSSYRGETGYIHFHGANVVTSQQISVPQNILPVSENFAAWTEEISANAATVAGVSDPLGGTNAYRLRSENIGGTGQVGIRYEITLPAAGTYTFSLHAKQEGSIGCSLSTANFDNGFPLVDFDLNAGTAETPTNTHVEDLGSGWYRIGLTFTVSGADLIGRVRFFVSDGTTTAVALNGVTSCLVFGAQLNKGAAPIGYSRTTGTALV